MNQPGIKIDDLISTVIKCAYNVRKVLKQGFLESVYANALLIELGKNNLKAAAEYPINVYYYGQVIGEFRADILVEDCLILELKAVKCLTSAHEVQLVNYLTATGIDNGVLINFGGEKLETKRKFRSYKPAH